jgi:transcription elongation factor GreA-like protein
MIASQSFYKEFDKFIKIILNVNSFDNIGGSYEQIKQTIDLYKHKDTNDKLNELFECIKRLRENENDNVSAEKGIIILREFTEVLPIIEVICK